MGINHNNWQIIYSILLIISCILNFYQTPAIICVLEKYCDNSVSSVIKGIFVRVVAVTGFLSRVVLLLKGKINLVKYKENMDAFHAFTPITSSDIDSLNKVSTGVMLCCILLTVPINLTRLWILWDLIRSTIVFVALSYIQNFSMYCIETHYTVLCFVLYQKFTGINKDLLTLKINTVMRNKYPFMSKTGEKYLKNNSTNYCNKEIEYSLTAGCPMSDIVENLKIKHKLCCEAIIHLNNLFGIQLGLSLCALCLYTMFDLYYHLVGILVHSNSNNLIYGWILQYSVRFAIVTVLPHATTKQVNKYNKFNFYVILYKYFMGLRTQLKKLLIKYEEIYHRFLKIFHKTIWTLYMNHISLIFE